jgi:REP element-mobilizing transposase RayT
MANTYTQIYVHVVFAVKGRYRFLEPRRKEELERYIAGIIRNRRHRLIAINIMPDHLHLFVSLHPSMSLSDLVRDIKAVSSKFINERRWVPLKFHWQDGFGAFSYSQSQIRDVAKYVRSQEKHHGKKSFRDEYLEILRKFNVAYDERYIVDGEETRGRPDGA